MRTQRFLFLLLLLPLLALTQTVQTDQWMGRLSAQIGDRPLSQVVLPGAYKAGLQRINGGTAIPDKCNSQTQDTTVYGLLQRGARYLDLSLVYWKDDTWYLGHYTYNQLFGVQIGVGQKLDEAMKDIVRFIDDEKHRSEVVVLHVSFHVNGKSSVASVSPYGDLAPALEKTLFDKLHAQLDPYLFNATEPIGSYSINQILASVQSRQSKKSGALVLLYSASEQGQEQEAGAGIIRANACGQAGQMPLRYAFKKTNRSDSLVANWKWLDQQAGDCYTVLPWALTWRSTDDRCTVYMAFGANQTLEDYLNKGGPLTLPQVISICFFDQRSANLLIRLNQAKKTKP